MFPLPKPPKLEKSEYTLSEIAGFFGGAGEERKRLRQRLASAATFSWVEARRKRGYHNRMEWHVSRDELLRKWDVVRALTGMNLMELATEARKHYTGVNYRLLEYRYSAGHFENFIPTLRVGRRVYVPRAIELQNDKGDVIGLAETPRVVAYWLRTEREDIAPQMMPAREVAKLAGKHSSTIKASWTRHPRVPWDYFKTTIAVPRAWATAERIARIKQEFHERRSLTHKGKGKPPRQYARETVPKLFSGSEPVKTALANLLNKIGNYVGQNRMLSELTKIHEAIGETRQVSGLANRYITLLSRMPSLTSDTAYETRRLVRRVAETDLLLLPRVITILENAQRVAPFEVARKLREDIEKRRPVDARDYLALIAKRKKQQTERAEQKKAGV